MNFSISSTSSDLTYCLSFDLMRGRQNNMTAFVPFSLLPFNLVPLYPCASLTFSPCGLYSFTLYAFVFVCETVSVYVCVCLCFGLVRLPNEQILMINLILHVYLKKLGEGFKTVLGPLPPLSKSWGRGSSPPKLPKGRPCK